ncbi:uncharacterized protein LOC111072653 [Drosophila obscura]|uniref:uncharacterized protein LOC111072653 n=1 Tax=Drosophila obscura TaxID=7282 RepID=UPI001BB13482|nr:uncharacterized protein LOC111072653 [Drosophila obscura]
MEIKRSKTSRVAEFDRDSKLDLIKAVEKRPVIWNLKDRKHFDTIASKSAWESVAAEIKKDANSCKIAWKSLKDSYRYHIKSATKKQLKNGSAGGVQMENPVANESVEWVFAPHMAFLPDLFTQRRTFTSIFFPEEDTESSPVGLDDTAVLETNWSESELNIKQELDDFSSSTYSYESKAKKRSVPKNETSASQVCEILEKLVNQQEAQAVVMNPVSAYWDYMLSSLPLEDRAEVEDDVTQLIIARKRELKKAGERMD